MIRNYVKNERIKEENANKKQKEDVVNPLLYDNHPQPFYNGAVHPDDLQPIYANWNIDNNKHGKENQVILPQNKLFRRS